MQNVCIRLLPLRNVGRALNSHASSSKSSAVDLTKPQVVVCSNGVVACWHPKIEFAYENSRPIEESDLRFAKKKEAAVFNDAVLGDYERSRMRQGPTNAELTEIFYTSKNEWFTRTREDRLYDVAAPLPKRKK
ncbi:hypothetical protein L596_011719 [Steinernema carpocapsae]|uniref:Uncharacterized protein n=1 Tax=Steinernema carpocapsae TaxID=34508 RepID=A0A4U5NV88_STECR|nr:hypothetical protein L596_011719 [Steinernema carpocapsae]